jgi:hypothetical protein
VKRRHTWPFFVSTRSGSVAVIAKRRWSTESTRRLVFERPSRVVQRALAATVAPIVRRRGRSLTGDVLRASIIPPERWPDPGDRAGTTSR